MKRFFTILLAAVLALSMLPLVGAAQPTVVYVNGTKSSSGDGSSAKTAVRTLREAYSLLSRTAGGTIVVCGRTEAGDWSQELEKNPFTAAVTLTSRHGTEDYSADAALVFTDRYFYFGGKTVLTDLLLQTSINTYLYSGADLTVKRSVRTSMPDTDAKLSIYCGLRTARCESVRVDLAGGTFTQILLSTTKGTGTTEARLSGDVYINSNVTLGASGTADLIRLTMDGGSVDKLYATPRSGGTTKAAELILRGGQFESFTDAPTLKKTTTLGELTVTLGPEFICDNLGAWEDSKLNLTGTRTLNWLNYAGGTLKGLDRYDRVNLLGGDTIPSAKEGGYMRLYGYSGQFSADPSGFPTLYVDGGSEATLLRTLPSETALSVDADSILRLASPWNEEGRAEAALIQPELTAVSPVLRVDFEQSADDRSSSGNNGVLHGSPAFVQSYDGSRALHLQNDFGGAAEEYVSFAALQGIDLRRDDYTFTLWYRTENGGFAKVSGGGDGKAAHRPVSFTGVRCGGTLLSNRDMSDTKASGMTALQLAQRMYFAVGVTDATGGRHDKGGIWQPQDGRWHQLAIVCDRDGYYRTYVDGELLAWTDISDCSDDALGSNAFCLGADVLGRYGAGNIFVDDLALYPAALPASDLNAFYLSGRLKALKTEITDRLAALGSEYGDTAALQAAVHETANYSPAQYPQAAAAYDALKTQFDSFLSAPQSELSLLLLSDVHVVTENGGRRLTIDRIFSDAKQVGVDGVIVSGDFADNASASTVRSAFAVTEARMDPQWQLFPALGNHEVHYSSETSCFRTGATAYWESLQAHISAQREFGSAALDSTQNYSYAMTLKGYHFVVLNTDPQTQNADDPDPLRRRLYLTDETLQWLDRTMERYGKDGKPIFVVSHFPFAASVPHTEYHEVVVKDRTIGSQDAQIRAILAKQDNVVYFCGHLHYCVGTTPPVTVYSGHRGFTEVMLPSLKSGSHGYRNLETSWYLFAYDDEMVLRAKDFSTGEWLTEYDAVIPLGARVNCPTERYVDLPERAWYHAAVDDCFRRGLMNGVSDTRFEPEETLSRAMLVTVLYRMAGSPAVDGSHGFSDVKSGSWYDAAVRWAKQSGVVNGVDETHFAPNESITREQMAAMFCRYAAYKGFDTAKRTSLDGYTDAASISNYAKEPMAWAVARGLLQGTAATTVSPLEGATRAQIATVLIRFCQKLGG